jgi:hypothetical protein
VKTYFKYRPHFAFPLAAWYGVIPRAQENNKTDNKITIGMIFFIEIKSKSWMFFILKQQNITKNRETKASRLFL